MNPEARRMMLRICRGCDEHKSSSSMSSDVEDVRILGPAVLAGDFLMLDKSKYHRQFAPCGNERAGATF
eukprot:243287-Chlamydomonas_euryale.AAC.14